MDVFSAVLHQICCSSKAGEFALTPLTTKINEQGRIVPLSSRDWGEKKKEGDGTCRQL